MDKELKELRGKLENVRFLREDLVTFSDGVMALSLGSGVSKLLSLIQPAIEQAKQEGRKEVVDWVE